jgi:FixJ family two-component response regulator
LYSGRGRFFLNAVHSVSAIRPIVAVIEADEADRRSLCSLLSSLDADVHDYDSAESYLASSVDALGCVITDVMLPGMSGLELLRLLRATKVAPPVILLGEESDVRAAVDAMREGAADFIEKGHMDLAIPRRVAYLLDRNSPAVKH